MAGLLLLLCATFIAPSAASFQWELSNLSNVYGDGYKLPTVWLAADDIATDIACRSICANLANCTSYDYAAGAKSGGNQSCKFLKQCWLRSDQVWTLKPGKKCAKRAGRKVAPTPAPPPTLPPSPAPANALNVLFIIFDDLRVIHEAWDQEQPFGPYTPNTDKLAAKSLIFDRAYCQQAVCGPSRASLLSGRRPDGTQMWNFVGGFRQTAGADKWNTWPQWFKKKGYYTAGCGKLFHPGDPASFDPQSWSDGHYSGYFGQGSCPLKDDEVEANAKNGSGCAVPASLNYTDYPDVQTLAVAKQLLANASALAAQPQPVPFWIGVGFVKPHLPHVFPEEFLDHVPAVDDVPIATNAYPPTNTSFIEWESGAEGPSGKTGPITPPDPTSAREYRRSYYAAAAFSDSLLGELLDELDARGFTNSTITILTSDHGWGLGEHNHWIKYTNWETDARVPLLVHHPRAPQTFGKHTPSLVEHVDLYPSLSEMAMGNVPGHVDPSVESIEGESYAVLFDAKLTPDPSKRLWTSRHNASFTQYPRCCGDALHPHTCAADGSFSTNKRCAGVPKHNFSYMGYSIRTDRWRYTEWAEWNGPSLEPVWMANPAAPGALVELYDHALDTGSGKDMWNLFENENVAHANGGAVRQLSARIRAFFAPR